MIHPNVHFETGAQKPIRRVRPLTHDSTHARRFCLGGICLDILKDKWSPLYDVRTILLSIQSLLGEPNNASPLNPRAAQLWSNTVEFRALVVRTAAEAAAKK